MSPFPTVTQCSVTCGQGKATRQVICINYSDQLVDRSECDPDDVPATEQECSMSPCHPNSHDYGRPIHPFLYPDHHLKVHPGGSLNRNRAHIPGGNQWRIGPWGAVSDLFFLLLRFWFFSLSYSMFFLQSAHSEERDLSPWCLLSAHTSVAVGHKHCFSRFMSPRLTSQKANGIIFHEAEASICFLAISWDIYSSAELLPKRSRALMPVPLTPPSCNALSWKSLKGIKHKWDVKHGIKGSGDYSPA